MNALKEMMDRLGLNTYDVSWCLGDSRGAVVAWIRPRESSGYRSFPSGRDLQLELTEGGRIVADLASAAELSGLDEAGVTEQAERACVFLRGAIERDAKENGDLLVRIVSGRPTRIGFGAAVALIAGELAFVPIRAGRRIVLVTADVSAVACDGGLSVRLRPRAFAPPGSAEAEKRRSASRIALSRLEARKEALLDSPDLWNDASVVEELSEIEDEKVLITALLRTLS
jgi:hypothetical protein